MTEREDFLREWFLLLRKYEKSNDRVVAYGVKLQQPLLSEVSDYAVRVNEPGQPRLVSPTDGQ